MYNIVIINVYFILVYVVITNVDIDVLVDVSIIYKFKRKDVENWTRILITSKSIMFFIITNITSNVLM